MEGRGYSSEDLTWHTGSWDATDEEKDFFACVSKRLYTNLYEALTAGTPLKVTMEHVRQQIAVIEERHRHSGGGGDNPTIAQ